PRHWWTAPGICSPTSTSTSCSSARPAGAPRNSTPGSAPASPPAAERASSSWTGAPSTSRWESSRRRTSWIPPGSVTPSARDSSPGPSRGSRSSGPHSSARSSRPTSWRPRAHRNGPWTPSVRGVGWSRPTVPRPRTRSPRCCPPDPQGAAPAAPGEHRVGRAGSEADRVVPLLDLRRDPALDKDAVPDHEEQQRLEPTTVVGDPPAVLVKHQQPGCLVHELVGPRSEDVIARPVVQFRDRQTVTGRDREAELLPVQHVCGHDALQRFVERVLGGAARDLL